jgi:hypothetical protein
MIHPLIDSLEDSWPFADVVFLDNFNSFLVQAIIHGMAHGCCDSSCRRVVCWFVASSLKVCRRVSGQATWVFMVLTALFKE